MLESLLGLLESPPEDTGNVIFLYDPVTNTELMGTNPTIVLSGGAVADAANPIDGRSSLSFPSTSAGLLITFATPLNLQGKNWTVEWSSKNTTAAASYAHEFSLLSSTAGTGVLSRYGDQGFQNRLHFGTSFGVANNTWAPAITKANATNVLNHYALVCKDGQIKIFCNGLQQSLARGTTTVYNLQSFTPQDSLANITRLRLGFEASSTPAVTGYHGRIRISDFARYSRSYTYVPF